MIKVENLHKSFGDTDVLKGISTVFDKGKTNLIIGQSGSGKTVFLKNLVGLFEPEQGYIYYEDRRYQNLSASERRNLRKEMGMVFQGGALFDSMNVEENVKFPLRMFTKLNNAEMKNRVQEVLERVNLKDVNTRFPAEISGGMQKRVSIARAIVNRPKFLFCDEPNSGLDPRTATVIDNLIQELTKEYDITTVINTHDMNSVFEIGEKIVYLQDGHLAWEGTKEEIHVSENKDLTDFVYSSNLFRKVKVAYQKGL
ncbi:ABC transporter ATP-binding protein [Psychroflexus planctonicus]|uniref:Phosphonate ABC transporter ATP-binding protein n=1 Tax=Psychroflexus planctonicus TaxID=1526575 RepID=A0ABQ1SEE1_9FLAO|nr:ATP-binding cassette domain-containing protein [Psychroflexus planctonicus]GGE24922.1 phosphonate ABC transporter ATP-binding protein [Psychroflexus planctonicus]